MKQDDFEHRSQDQRQSIAEQLDGQLDLEKFIANQEAKKQGHFCQHKPEKWLD